jgi:DNA-binding transcriptional regulator YdaS (Cro superfamily)
MDYSNVTLTVRETNMQTTRELYQAAKAAAGVKSDYAFAQVLGVTRSACSQYANGKSTFDDVHAAMIAGILGREPGEVMALCAAERAKDTKSRARWLHVAALLAAIGLPPAHGGQLDNNGPKAAKNNVQTDNYAKWRDAMAVFLFGDWLRLA